jgi:WD40 repeat protein/serine/threonine protein kinase
MSAPLDHVLNLTDEEWVRLERITGRFEEAWREGARPVLETFLPSDPGDRAAALIELVHVELELRIRAGEPACAEEYLRRFPELEADGAIARDLIASEMKLRRANNPGLSLEDYIARFPMHARELHRLWDDWSGSDFSPLAAGGADRKVRPPARIGRFEPKEVVGEGAFGIVHRAWDTEANRDVALKVLRPEQLARRGVVDRLLREAQSTARLIHPNIVRVHEAGWSGTTCYLVSDLIHGSTLAVRLAQGGLSFKQTSELVDRVADALEFAHQAGVVHRDLKPSNILIDAEGQPHITDFGLATGDAGEATLTVDGELLGTPAYMSPEQARGEAHGVDGRSDIYSLGVVLYELLTGVLPFRGGARKILHQVLTAEPLPPRLLKESIPRDLETICLKALAKEPSDRYSTALALADDLRRFQRGEPVRARPAGRWRRIKRKARKHPAVVALFGFVVVATALGLGASVWERRRDDVVLASQERAALAARERLDSSRYIHLIGLADRELAAANLVRAQELLDDCPVQRRGWEWFYLKSLSRAAPRELRRHQGIVFEVAFSRDSRRLASAGGDRTVRLWDVATDSELLVLRGHDGPVYGVNFAPTEAHLASAGGDGTVRIWDLSTGQPVQVIRAHRGIVYSVCFSPDGRRLASAGADGAAKIWDLASGRERHHLRGHTEAVFGVTFRSDGQQVATASADGNVRVWDARTGRALHVLSGQTGAVMGVAYSPDGTRLASASGAGMVKLWNSDTGTLLRSLEGHAGVVYGVAFSPDGQRLASAGADRTVRLWIPETGQELLALRGYGDAVWNVAFSLDGRRLASAGGDGRIRLISPMAANDQTDTSLMTLRAHKNVVRCVAFSPNGRRLASGGGGIIRIWDVESAQIVRSLRGHAGVVFALDFSPDGTRLASAGGDGTVRIWNASTGEELQSLRPNPLFSLTSVAYSADGKRLVSAGGGGVIRVWNAETGAETLTIQSHASSTFSVAFSPDGQRLASAGGDGSVRVWDSETGRPLPGPRGHGNQCFSVGFSPDGRSLASVGTDSTLEIWDAQDGQERSFPLGGGQYGHALAFSPEGSTIATADAAGIIKLWDTATGRQTQIIHAHTGAILGVAFSPDGQRLASCGWDRTVKVWNLDGAPEPDSSGARQR